jgi:DNA-binding response OmpR family regulator
MAEMISGVTPRFDRVRFVMGEDGLDTSGVMDSLYARGLRKAVHCGAKDQLLEALDAEIVDVLMYDHELLNKDFVDVMQRIRRKVYGKNPFLIIIAAVRDSAFQTVRQLISAGADDLIRKPISIDRLFESLNTFSHRRKPFTVSYDYVGPTRRLGKRGVAGQGGVQGQRGGQGQDHEQLIRVPNTLRSRAVEGVSDAELEGLVNAAVSRIDDKRKESYGIEVDILAKKLLEAYTTTTDDREVYLEIKTTLQRIELIGDDLRRRSKESPMDRVGDLATMMVALAQRIFHRPIGSAMIEVRLLEKLAVAIRRSVSVERNSLGVMQEIATTIARFTRLN